MKKITTTGSRANFLSPKPNGQGFDLIQLVPGCWLIVYLFFPVFLNSHSMGISWSSLHSSWGLLSTKSCLAKMILGLCRTEADGGLILALKWWALSSWGLFFLSSGAVFTWEDGTGVWCWLLCSGSEISEGLWRLFFFLFLLFP